MNILTVRDATGRVVRETSVFEGETIRFSLGEGQYSMTLTAPPGFQLNGHRLDCRCGTCRPDLYVTSAWVPSHDPWRRG